MCHTGIFEAISVKKKFFKMRDSCPAEQVC